MVLYSHNVYKNNIRVWLASLFSLNLFKQNEYIVPYRWPHPAYTTRFGGAGSELIKAQRRGSGREVGVLKQGPALEALRPKHLVVLPQKLDSIIVLAQAFISVPLTAQLGCHSRSVNGLHDCHRSEMSKKFKLRVDNTVGWARLSQWGSGWPSHCFRDWRVKERVEAGSCGEKGEGWSWNNRQENMKPSLDRVSNLINVTFPWTLIWLAT